MSEIEPQLAVHKGLRGDIVLELKRSQPLTARELAERMSVSANAIRHHLKELEAEALILYGREQRGVGAPTYAYRLSPKGEALFPRRYEQALTQLVGRLVEKDGRRAAVELFEDHFRALTDKARVQLSDAAASERMELISNLLTEAGYMADWQESAGVFRLLEHNCAMRAVAEQFPEVCEAEENFLREVLGGAVERRAHISSGCNACEYAISFAGRPAAGGDSEDQS